MTQSPKSISLVPPPKSRYGKLLLWCVLCAMTISVILYTEVPIFRRPQQLIPTLIVVPWILFPHIAAGLVALACGPIQFSNKFRASYPKWHRIIGRVYVVSIFISAPLAFILATRVRQRQTMYFILAIALQGGAWLITTIAALLAVCRRRIPQHRVWMIRSYAVTFTFVGTRILQPISAWNHLGHTGFPIAIMLITAMALLVPGLASQWNKQFKRAVSRTIPIQPLHTSGSEHSEYLPSNLNSRDV